MFLIPLGLKLEISMVIKETQEQEKRELLFAFAQKEREVQSLGKSKYLRKCKRRRLIFIPWILILFRAKKRGEKKKKKNPEKSTTLLSLFF